MNMAVWMVKEPVRLNIEILGFIPQWININDPRSAREQLNAGYAHGGGWREFGAGEWRMDPNGTLHYPGDPAIKPIACGVLRDELIFVYYHGLVAIRQPDNQFEVARMD